MEEGDGMVWDTVVRRWQEAKRVHTDTVTELILAQARLTHSLSELQTKLSDIQLDGDHGVDIMHDQPRVYQTRLHRLLYGVEKELEQDKEIAQREIARREKLQHRKRISTLRIRAEYVTEQVKKFFRYELRSNEVFMLLDRAHCLELQLKIILRDIEQFDHNSNVL